jgi:hypothetical protein
MNEMTRILTICPSIYPEKFDVMCESFYNTCSKDNILFTTSVKGVTESINDAFKRYPDFDFYHITNDDAIYETHNWDTKLAKKGKITHGTDSVPEGVNGQFFMIDGDFVRALGWLQLPTLNRYAGDVVWRFIGEQLGILEHVPEVVIRHNWEGCAEPMVNQLDMAEFAKWLPWAFKDIKKIKEKLCIK